MNSPGRTPSQNIHSPQHPSFGSWSINPQSAHFPLPEFAPESPPSYRSNRNFRFAPVDDSKGRIKEVKSGEVKSFDRPLPSVPQSGQPAEPEGLGWRFHAAFGCLCIVNLVCALDATSLAVAIPIVAQKLHGNAIEASWWGTSFLLTATVFQPTFAALSHAFGRKPLLLIALTFFTVGSILAAIANDSAMMLVGRSIQGVGGGGISALTYVIVTDMVTLKDRGKWFGLISMMWAFGSVAGPVIGGALAEKVSWRWIFWLNIPFCALAFVMIPIFLKMNPVSGTLREKVVRVDWIGSILFIGSITAILIPLTWGGLMFPWSHWKTVLPMGAGFCGLLLFIIWSTHVPNQPILRGSMFKAPTALASYFGTIVHGMFLWSALYYMPLYFEGAKGFSPINAGIGLFPWTFTTGPAAVVTGLIVAKTGRYRWGIWSGWLLTASGIGLMMLFKADTKAYEWIPLSTISGLGLGILYPSMSFAIQAAASNRDLPFAAALYSFFRNFGQMLGVAVGGAIFQNRVKSNLLSYEDLADKAVAYSKDASALVEVIKHYPPQMAAVKHEIVAAYVDALRSVWLIMCILATVALVLAVLFTKGITLERELETEQGFQRGGNVQDKNVQDKNVHDLESMDRHRIREMVSNHNSYRLSYYGGNF